MEKERLKLPSSLGTIEISWSFHEKENGAQINELYKNYVFFGFGRDITKYGYK